MPVNESDPRTRHCGVTTVRERSCQPGTGVQPARRPVMLGASPEPCLQAESRESGILSSFWASFLGGDSGGRGVPVAETSNGLDEPGTPRIGLDFASQVADAKADAFRRRFHGIHTPYQIEQPILAQHLSAMA